MSVTDLPTLVGLVAGCVSSYSLMPQLAKCWRADEAEAVSKRMFATRAFGLVLWCVYGFFAGSLPVMIFSTVNLVLSITILVLTVRKSRGEDGQLSVRPGNEQPVAADLGPSTTAQVR